MEYAVKIIKLEPCVLEAVMSWYRENVFSLVVLKWDLTFLFDFVLVIAVKLNIATGKWHLRTCCIDGSVEMNIILNAENVRHWIG